LADAEKRVGLTGLSKIWRRQIGGKGPPIAAAYRFDQIKQSIGAGVLSIV